MMTNLEDQAIPQYGDQQTFEGNPARHDQVQRATCEGREGEPNEDDQFTIQHGLMG